MNKNFKSDMNIHEDIDKKIKCLTLSNGADLYDEYKWIVNNINEFKKQSIVLYNNVIEHIIKKLNSKLFLIVNEQHEYGFSHKDKCFGIWHKYKELNLLSENADIYINNNWRLNYKEINKLSCLEIPAYSNEIFIISKLDNIKNYLAEISINTSLFDSLYNLDSVLIKMRDLYTEGNSLTFYSKRDDDLSLIIECAKEEGFTLL